VFFLAIFNKHGTIPPMNPELSAMQERIKPLQKLKEERKYIIEKEFKEIFKEIRDYQKEGKKNKKVKEKLLKAFSDANNRLSEVEDKIRDIIQQRETHE